MRSIPRNHFFGNSGGTGTHSANQKQSLPRNHCINSLSNSLNLNYTYTIFDTPFGHGINNARNTGDKNKRYRRMGPSQLNE